MKRDCEQEIVKIPFHAESIEKALGDKSKETEKVFVERFEANNGWIAALSKAKGTIIRGVVDSGAADHVTNKEVAPQIASCGWDQIHSGRQS